MFFVPIWEEKIYLKKYVKFWKKNLENLGQNAIFAVFLMDKKIE